MDIIQQSLLPPDIANKLSNDILSIAEARLDALVAPARKAIEDIDTLVNEYTGGAQTTVDRFHNLLARTDEEMQRVCYQMVRPSVLYRPALIRNDTGWTVKYGDLFATGETPDEAAMAFDEMWK